jgi:hypothetical protein
MTTGIPGLGLECFSADANDSAVAIRDSRIADQA